MTGKSKYIDKAELKARIKDGLANRVKSGEMSAPGSIVALPDKRGAHFTKAQRKHFTQICELAIYELANYQFREWYHLIAEITKVMVAANFQKAVVLHTCKSIEHIAVQCTGDKTLYAQCQKFLYDIRNRVISIPGQRPGLSTNKKAAAHDPQNPPNDRQPTRDHKTRPTGNGKAR